MVKNLVWIEEVEGRDKPNYHNVGIVFIKDGGKMSVKLNTVPVGNFNGWLQVFDQKPKNEIPSRDVNTEKEPF